ncbi:unnamed protein product [Ceratitis capitata]|uniref:(Mediterranean fruit fly) hypothetical protein n=1 Tax=Ceratitis capitata TaxID=7213 RepID=A0A811VAL5_CERCA|nr:unnamed protein product [Ceratitis capitata]
MKFRGLHFSIQISESIIIIYNLDSKCIASVPSSSAWVIDIVARPSEPTSTRLPVQPESDLTPEMISQ